MQRAAIASTAAVLLAIATVGASAAEKPIKRGPKQWLEVPGITHFQMYVGDAFETSANAAADCINKHL